MFYSIPLLHRFSIRIWLGICIILAACGTTTVNAPILQPPPTCVSSSSETNPYLSHSPSGAGVIYTNYKNNIVSLGTARQDALFQLGRNTEHWSDQVNIAIDDFQMVRIIITYLDPVLIQYAVLNFILNDPANLMDPNSFNNKLTEIMNDLGRRNEMLFVVTVTSPFYREQAYNNNVLTVRMPIEQLTLISSADARVTPTHEDHILDESIDITHGPVSGIVGYPLAVMHQEQCVWIIDQWTNTLTLDVPSVTLGTTPFSTQFWSIPYQSLVMETNNRPIPTYDQIYEWNPINNIKTPPTPNWEPNTQFDDTNWTTYWEDMGRYLWNFVITESHH